MAACIAPIRIRDPGDPSRFIDVPCSKCYACLNRKRSEWLLRLEHEHRDSTRSLFLTLTYDDEHLPLHNSELCFQKKDLQDFFKRLRHHASFRYYAVSEYGGQRGRPHYHLLFFNYEGKSDAIYKSWKLGHVHIGDVTSASINYCAAYVITKQQFKYEKDDPRKPFALYSRRPALGAGYIERYGKYHRMGLKNLAIRPYGGGKTPLPRYYKERIFNWLDRSILAAQAKQHLEAGPDTVLSYEDYIRKNPGRNFHDYSRYRCQLIAEANKRVFNNLKQNRNGQQNF